MRVAVTEAAVAERAEKMADSGATEATVARTVMGGEARLLVGIAEAVDLMEVLTAVADQAVDSAGAAEVAMALVAADSTAAKRLTLILFSFAGFVLHDCMVSWSVDQFTEVEYCRVLSNNVMYMYIPT